MQVLAKRAHTALTLTRRGMSTVDQGIRIGRLLGLAENDGLLFHGRAPVVTKRCNWRITKWDICTSYTTNVTYHPIYFTS